MKRLAQARGTSEFAFRVVSKAAEPPHVLLIHFLRASFHTNHISEESLFAARALAMGMVEALELSTALFWERRYHCAGAVKY